MSEHAPEPYLLIAEAVRRADAAEARQASAERDREDALARLRRADLRIEEGRRWSRSDDKVEVVASVLQGKLATPFDAYEVTAYVLDALDVVAEPVPKEAVRLALIGADEHDDDRVEATHSADCTLQPHSTNTPCGHRPDEGVTQHGAARQKYQRALFDLLTDVSLALVDTDEMLHDRVQAFMDIEPNDENFEIVSPGILVLIERAATATALSDHWLREMRRMLP